MHPEPHPASPSAGGLTVRFHGTRGSLPVSGAQYGADGGNTPCVEIRNGGRTVCIIDAGTGLASLGLELAAAPPGAVHILLSHFHWDHLQGIPFFKPLYSPDWSVSFYSACDPEATRDAVAQQTASPFFPAGAAVSARLHYLPAPERGFQIGAVRVTPFALNHPGGACGYRVEAAGACVVYVSDHEHGNSAIDESIRAHAAGAGLLIWDSQYTPEDYPAHRGWGHGTWLEGVRAARGAGAARLALFHHDPERTAERLADIERAARGEFPDALAARDGLEITLPGSISS
jgi:phosphoribosyl 1,2-cyclic phosphodiesterase